MQVETPIETRVAQVNKKIDTKASAHRGRRTSAQTVAITDWAEGKFYENDQRDLGLGITEREISVPLASTTTIKRIQNMDSAVDSEGGYLLREQFADYLELVLQGHSPVRRAATVIRRDWGETFRVGVGDDTANSGEIIAPSTTTASNEDPVFTQAVLAAHKFSSKKVVVPYELFEDSDALTMSLADMLGQRIARKQNQAFTVGSGPVSGIVAAAGLGATAASATVIAIDEVFALIDSVDVAYRENASLMLHPTVYSTLRQLKDSSGNYLWMASGLNEVPVLLNADMEPTPATTDRVILYGDFSRVLIRDLGPIRVHRMDEDLIPLDQRGFIGYLRSDCKLLTPNALKALAMA